MIFVTIGVPYGRSIENRFSEANFYMMKWE